MRQVPDGIYRYCRVNQEDDSLQPQGLIEVDHGQVSILDDPKSILKSIFDDVQSPELVFDIMSAANRNGYAKFIKDDSSSLVEQYEGNHDPATITKENKQADFTKLSHLKAILEKEDDGEFIDIPEHIVLKASSHHWNDNE